MSRTIHILHHTIRLSWTLFAAGVLVVASLVSVARLILPLAQDYRAELQQVASEQLGRPVSIERVTAGWTGIHPQVRFVGVTVYEPDGKTVWLHLDEVRASIKVISSLWHRHFETGAIKFVGAHLDVARQSDGSYLVAGVKTGTGGIVGHGGKRMLAWLVARERVEISRSSINWSDSRLSSRPLQFTGVELSLDLSKGLHRISGAAELAGDGDQRLRFLLEVAGDASHPETLTSNFYLQGRIRLGSWIDGSVLEHTRIDSGLLDYRLWGSGRDRLDHLVGDLSMSDLVWHNLPHDGVAASGPKAGFSLDKLSGKLFWTYARGGWSLDLQQVKVARAGDAWPAADLHLAVTPKGAQGDRTLEGYLSFVRLQDVNAFLLGLSGLDDTVRQVLTATNPRGDLRGLAFRLHRKDRRIDHFFVQGQFDDLSMDRWGKLPGISGLDGRLRADEHNGYLDLTSRDVSIDEPRLFPGPITATELIGRFYWSHDADGWHIQSRELRAGNEDIRTHGRVALEIPPAGEGGSPFLDMQLAFRDGKVGQARRYLPRGIMPADVVEWLDQALSGGRVNSGGMLYFGHLRDFPFRNHDGIFQVNFGVEDGILDYAPGWPRIEDVMAEVEFENHAFQARVRSGKIYSLDLAPTTVSIPNLGKGATLQIKGGAQGGTGDMLRFLVDSPLAAEYSDVLSGVQTQGQADLSLDLSLPLKHLDRHTARVRLRLDNDSVKLPAWNLSLDRVSGDLRVAAGASGLSYAASDVKARYRGRPATLNVSTLVDNSGRRTRVDLRTRVPASGLLGERTAVLAPYLKGSSDWLLRADVAPASGKRLPPVDLHVESTLKGVAVNLPHPLAKPADEARSLAVDVRLDAGQFGPVSVSYGRTVRGALLFQNGVLSRGQLRFGGAKAVLPKTAGLFVAGSLDRFSLSAWQQWLAALPANGTAPGVLGSLAGLQLQADDLELFNYHFHQVRLNANREGDFWVADINSRELAGKLRAPVDMQGSNPLVLDLTAMHLHSPATDAKPQTGDPRSLPPLRIRCQNFTYDDMPLGRLDLVARRGSNGLDFDRLDLDSPYFKVKSTGSWTLQDGKHRSSFKIAASTQNLGEALTRLGYQSGIDGGQASAHVDAYWAGPPSWFQLSRLNGTLRMLVKHGQLLDVNPGGGRMLGLLSLQALPRRLTLDFSDLFRRGFAFDRIQGSFTIADGDAYTNDLYMAGPSARFDISGRIGLVTRDYDQLVVVTPRVTSSIPVVGGLAGGPGVGLGLWVAERVFGRKIDELSRVRYTITGSWEDPKVERLGGESKRSEPPPQKPSLVPNGGR